MIYFNRKLKRTGACESTRRVGRKTFDVFKERAYRVRVKRARAVRFRLFVRRGKACADRHGNSPVRKKDSAAAAIRLSRDGKTIYDYVRGENEIRLRRGFSERYRAYRKFRDLHERERG